MVDERALASIFSLTTGVWTIAGILALTTWRIWNGLPAVMAQWVAWRQAKMADKLAREQAAAEAKAADWSRLRGEVDRLLGRVDTLEEKCDKLEGEVDACRQREAEWMRRAIEAEAALMGRGRADQEAQLIVSAERQKDKGK